MVCLFTTIAKATPSQSTTTKMASTKAFRYGIIAMDRFNLIESGKTVAKMEFLKGTTKTVSLTKLYISKMVNSTARMFYIMKMAMSDKVGKVHEEQKMVCGSIWTRMAIP